MALTGHQPIHTDVGANCVRGLCAPLRAGHARTGLANPATGPNTATVALATFVAVKTVGSATCQQRSRRGAFEEQLTGIGCTHSRGWLNQVKEHGRTGRDCSAARGGSTAAQYRCPKYPLRSRARRPGSARFRISTFAVPRQQMSVATSSSVTSNGMALSSSGWSRGSNDRGVLPP